MRASCRSLLLLATTLRATSRRARTSRLGAASCALACGAAPTRTAGPTRAAGSTAHLGRPARARRPAGPCAGAWRPAGPRAGRCSARAGRCSARAGWCSVAPRARPVLVRSAARVGSPVVSPHPRLHGPWRARHRGEGARPSLGQVGTDPLAAHDMTSNLGAAGNRSPARGSRRWRTSFCTQCPGLGLAAVGLACSQRLGVVLDPLLGLRLLGDSRILEARRARPTTQLQLAR